MIIHNPEFDIKTGDPKQQKINGHNGRIILSMMYRDVGKKIPKVGDIIKVSPVSEVYYKYLQNRGYVMKCDYNSVSGDYGYSIRERGVEIMRLFEAHIAMEEV